MGSLDGFFQLDDRNDEHREKAQLAKHLLYGIKNAKADFRVHLQQVTRLFLGPRSLDGNRQIIPRAQENKMNSILKVDKGYGCAGDGKNIIQTPTPRARAVDRLSDPTYKRSVVIRIQRGQEN
jgi:hypothetical protein